MGIDINPALRACGISSNMQIVPGFARVNFAQNSPDRFESSNPLRYTNEVYLTKLVNSNPKIKAILKEVNAPVEVNSEVLKDLLEHHCADVKTISMGIAEHLPFSLKSQVNMKALENAAYLHDIGKVLIPDKILNKKGRLDDYETKVMHKHSELGYEILKNTDIDKTTLNLIRNHHQNAKRSGYPFVNNDFRADLNLQILTMADKYSALTEKRVYKDAMAPEKALTIIYADVKEGKLHPFVFKALVNYAAETSEKTPISV